MDNSRPSLGPGSAILGGAAPAMAAMAQPGGVGTLQSQVSPASAIYNPGIQQPAQPPLPNGSPMSMFHFQNMLAQNQQQQPQQSQQQPKSQSHVIVEALVNRLKDIAKLEQNQGGI